MEKITETTNKKDSENKIKIKNYSKKESIFSRLAHVLGVILILLLVGLPKDLWRWLRLKRKCVRGKTVVITGGASGIKGAEQVAQGIKNLGGNAEAWECDISEEEEMKKCAKEIIEKFGTVDIVICNAAVLYFALINELKSEEIKML
uniref:SDR family NAD(P)-dependent oxidoreductase n=1 Tax=Meloidogyne hapla TaxID=6305 RepID=A0A1I8BWI6_MELHA